MTDAGMTRSSDYLAKAVALMDYIFINMLGNGDHHGLSTRFEWLERGVKRS
jgi:hypothetical protein